MARLIIVSNRLPVTIRTDGESVRLERSPGGLATGLAGPHARADGLWIGWPGDVASLSEERRAEVVHIAYFAAPEEFEIGEVCLNHWSLGKFL